MPLINEYKCSKCGFELQIGWGYSLYVEDDKGDRTVCGHPAERRCIEEVLGKDAPLEIIRERTGFSSHCVCLDCLHQFRADLGEIGWSPFTGAIGAIIRPQKDKRECPECKSIRVKTILETVDKSCPKCREGFIEAIWIRIIS